MPRPGLRSASRRSGIPAATGDPRPLRESGISFGTLRTGSAAKGKPPNSLMKTELTHFPPSCGIVLEPTGDVSRPIAGREWRTRQMRVEPLVGFLKKSNFVVLESAPFTQQPSFGYDSRQPAVLFIIMSDNEADKHTSLKIMIVLPASMQARPCWLTDCARVSTPQIVIRPNLRFPI